MSNAEIYNDNFYKARDELTQYSAKKILEIVKGYVDVTSIVDVGGGVGTFLKTAQDIFLGGDILLLEGEYVKKERMVVPQDCYKACDLEQRIHIRRSFDLVISLEVAEHLSEQRAASFVEDLTNLGEVVLFSAAAPYQGGEHHINEQPISYWVDLFKSKGYDAFDVIRPQIQYDKDILWWYRQNTLIYVNRDSAAYKAFAPFKSYIPLNMVCYDLYLEKVAESLKWRKITDNVFARQLMKVYHFVKHKGS